MFVKFLILLFFAQFIAFTAAQTPSVKINLNGHEVTVLGTKNLTWRDEEFYAFRGIHYAKAPLGDLRFKDPQVLESYAEVIDARYDGHDCPSITATNASEDCLTLNVYTRQLHSNASLPVVAFIHPGGLYLFSGLSHSIGPEYLLSHDIVLVTFNYRLGSLGFLNLGTPAVPGDAGFKDQVLALRWLHFHIQNFGGNPNDLTLMGYSAGALSVSLHLVSPMSRGLFHRAIIMSGVLPALKPLTTEQIYLAHRQAKLMNCSSNSSGEVDIAQCLSNFTGIEIAATLRRMFDFGKDNPIYLWMPVIEEDFGQERFLVEDFYAAIKCGNFNRVPMLIGWNTGEFCTSAFDILRDAKLLDDLNENFDSLAPKIFMFDNPSSNVGAINAALRIHYLRNSSVIRDENFDGLCDLFSDSIIRLGAYRLAKFAAEFVDTTTYTFGYSGRYSNLVYSRENRRPEHMDDLMYLFSMSPHHFTPDDAEAAQVELMTNFIYKFATNSLKVNCSFPISNVLINETLECRNGINFMEANFWDELFPPKE